MAFMNTEEDIDSCDENSRAATVAADIEAFLVRKMKIVMAATRSLMMVMAFVFVMTTSADDFVMKMMMAMPPLMMMVMLVALPVVIAADGSDRLLQTAAMKSAPLDFQSTWETHPPKSHALRLEGIFPICEKEGGPPFAMSVPLVRGLLEPEGSHWQSFWAQGFGTVGGLQGSELLLKGC